MSDTEKSGGRWMPSRAGIINAWRYSDETFEFHQGRLLLRGPNGSGKSMALELLFPFLLDARADQSRLSSASRSRGGLFDRVMAGHEEPGRVSFLWAEFTNTRSEEVLTIGVRLRAARSTHKVDKQWFTSSLKVGRELHLLDQNRAPLSIDRLRSAIESSGSGTLHSSADDYRRCVRELLFPSFSEPQYEALLSALLALRVEKVSQNITPQKLSEILTNSLPPLDELEIASLAEGFEKLEQRKEELASLRHQFHHVSKLAKNLRTYAGNVLKLRCAKVISATTNKDNVTRRERKASEDLLGAKATLTGLNTESLQVDQRLDELEETVATLKASTAFQEGAQIQPLRDQCGQERQNREAARQEADRRARKLEEAIADHVQSEKQCSVQSARCEVERAQVIALASDLGRDAAPSQLDSEAPATGEAWLRAWSLARTGQVRELRQLLKLLAQARSSRDAYDAMVEEQRQRVDERVQERGSADGALERARDAFAEALANWADTCTALDSRRLHIELRENLEPAHVRQAIRAIVTEARHVLVESRTLLAQEKKRVSLEQAEVQAEKARLVKGEEPPPLAPKGRRDRARLRGAPFWQLVDFHPEVGQATRDRIEAALDASGLLDAWVSSDGAIDLDQQNADSLLSTADTTPYERALDQVLIPVACDAVSEAMIKAILGSVAIEESALHSSHRAALGLDGSYRLQPLSGLSPQAPARFIGAATREQERQRKLAALKNLLTELALDLERIDHELGDIAAAEAKIRDEIEQSPTGADVESAWQKLDSCVQRLADAEENLRKAQHQRKQAEDALRMQQRELAFLAETHSLPTREEHLDELERALATLDERIRLWIRACAQLESAQAALARADKTQLDREQEKGAADQRFADARALCGKLQTRLRVLEESIGADFQHIQKQLESAGHEKHLHKAKQKQLRLDINKLSGLVGALQTTLETTSKELATAEEVRTQQQALLVAAVGDHLAEDAGVQAPAEPLAGVTSVLQAARELAKELASLAGTDKALTRAKGAVHDALHKASQELGGRVDLSFQEAQLGDWSLLRAASQGARQTIPELLTTLSAELEVADGELQENERRLFDETLTGSVREHVASRIRLASDLVKHLNQQLAEVKTDVAGVGVRLEWVVESSGDSPEAVRAARKHLLRDPADLSSAERDTLYEFFRSRIDLVREGDATLSAWDARLVEALDYRSWHTFRLQIRHASWEGYKDATSSRFTKLSTGERSIALHLPMLASIVAHYRSTADGEGPGCPRLIVLDELFAGVDRANRSKLLGMLVAWDLDAIFTSDNEWCTYPTLDGIAIHHVHADGHADGDPVTTSRFVWNGSECIAQAVDAR